jgi:hypothetical protein
MWATLRRDWKAILVQSVLTTVLFIGAIWGLSILMGASARNERVDVATARIVEEVRSVRTLLCEALSQAENPSLVQAVKENCDGEAS